MGACAIGYRNLKLSISVELYASPNFLEPDPVTFDPAPPDDVMVDLHQKLKGQMGDLGLSKGTSTLVLGLTVFALGVSDRREGKKRKVIPIPY